jgi:hypothetical protein
MKLSSLTNLLRFLIRCGLTPFHVYRSLNSSQARSNKSKDKPDTELDEFEKVRAIIIIIQLLLTPLLADPGGT